MSEAIRIPPMIRWGRSLLDVSPQNAFIVRFGVVVTLAIWIGKAPGLVDNSPTWILITSLMLLEPTSGGSMMKGLLRAAGTIFGAFTAIGLFGLYSQDPPLLMAGLLAVQVVAAYGYTGPRFKYAWFVWAFTTAIVLGGAMTSGEAVETVAFQRASAVGIGILIVFIVDSLFWPARSEPRLRELMAGRSRQLGEVLREIVSGATSTDEADSASPALSSQTMAPQLALLGELQAEIGVSRTRTACLMRLVFLLEAIASRTRSLRAMMSTRGESEPGDPALMAPRSVLANDMANAMAEVGDALLDARSPEIDIEALDQALLDLQGGWNPDSASERRRESVASWFADLRDLIGVLRMIEEAFSSGGSMKPAEASAAARDSGRWRPDAFRAKVALRTGLAVIAALLAPLVLGWPLNTMVAPLAFMMAALNRGAVVQTLSALAIAVAFGWLIADLVIVFVTPVIDQAPLALALAFALAISLAYVPRLFPKLALLPTMGGLVAILSIFGGPGASTSVEGSYNTVCYIALGSGMGWLFSQIMWPATASSLFRNRVAQQLAEGLVALERNRTDAESGRRGRAAALIHHYIEQSTQLAALHGQARLEPVEGSLDEGRRTQILALVAEMTDAILADRTGALDVLQQRNPDALRPVMDAIEASEEAFRSNLQRAVDAMRGQPLADQRDLVAAHRLVEERLDEWRQHPMTLPLPDEDGTHGALVEIDSRRRLIERQIEIDRWMEEWV